MLISSPKPIRNQGINADKKLMAQNQWLQQSINAGFQKLEQQMTDGFIALNQHVHQEHEKTRRYLSH